MTDDCANGTPVLIASRGGKDGGFVAVPDVGKIRWQPGQVTLTLDDFCPLPYLRRTWQGRFSPAAKRYHASQQALADRVTLLMREAGLESFGEKQIILGACFWVSDNRHRDLGNLVKAVEDALQGGVLYDNDRQIVGYMGLEHERPWLVRGQGMATMIRCALAPSGGGNQGQQIPGG